MRLANPLPGYPVTSRYGPRKPIPIPGGKTLPFHYGDDRAAPVGTPIRNSLAGVVTRVGFDNNHKYEELGIVRWPGLKKGWIYGGGYWVFVQTGNITVRYMHMQKWPSVKVGQRVGVGHILGYVGSTGVSTGPHLHQELLVGNVFVDPQTDLPDQALKGKPVTHRLFQNREKNRAIKPGQGLYLVNSRGHKVDINPAVGLNQTILHVKVTGLAPGDTVWGILEWQGPGGKISPHFPHTAVADNEGDVVFNAPFVRGVSRGWFVHAKIVASPKNKKTGKVEYIDADVIQFG